MEIRDEYPIKKLNKKEIRAKLDQDWEARRLKVREQRKNKNKSNQQWKARQAAIEKDFKEDRHVVLQWLETMKRQNHYITLRTALRENTTLFENTKKWDLKLGKSP